MASGFGTQQYKNRGSKNGKVYGYWDVDTVEVIDTRPPRGIWSLVRETIYHVRMRTPIIILDRKRFFSFRGPLVDDRTHCRRNRRKQYQ